MSNVMSASTIIIAGGMMTNVILKESDKGTNYAQFCVSANDGVSVWVTIFDEQMFHYLNRNARKGTQMEITGKLKRVGHDKDEKPTMSVTASDIRLTGNFGAEYVRKQDEKQHQGATA